MAWMERITLVLSVGSDRPSLGSVPSAFLSCKKVLWGALCFQCEVSPGGSCILTLGPQRLLSWETVEPLSDGTSQEE